MHDYHPVRPLGESPTSTVHLAKQAGELDREVALKVLRPGIGDGQVLARFELERQALSRLDHPCIAGILDAGETPEGLPFFAMERIDGPPITDYCDSHRLGLTARLRLFRSVCLAVEHAHQRGVIHRDIKPGNVLVAEVDGTATPRLIDFGVAKALADDDAPSMTRTTESLGTPGYASPEQTAGGDVDTRTDVYGLGVLLYELCVGTAPHDVERLTAANPLERLRILREEIPPRPSARLASSSEADAVARNRSASVTRLRQRLRADLDWITLRAVRAERDERYSSAAALAEDVDRLLTNRPVEARPPTAGYLLSRFYRRRRALVHAALVLIAVVLASVVVLLQSWGDVEASLTRFELLERVVRLREVRAEIDELFPAWPENEHRLATWIDTRGQPMVAARTEVGSAIAGLRELPGVEAIDDSWTMPDASTQFLHDTLTTLDAELERFEAELPRVRDRLEWARTVRAMSIDRHREAWAEATTAIRAGDGVTAHEDYRGLDVPPQLGLVPIGMNPNTLLWEFVHLRSGDGELPERDPDTGDVLIDETTGIVFVLLPTRTVWVGAQGHDRDGPNYDPRYDPNAIVQEGPPAERTFEAFFIGAHEITQRQWLVLTEGQDPSYYKHGATPGSLDAPRLTWRNPVESVSSPECTRILGRHRLRLPERYEWEYACRAGSETPWSGIDDPAELAGYVNIADRAAARTTSWRCETFLDDGHIVHAPVGSYLPNEFGLYDVHGNVSEWVATSRPIPLERGGSFQDLAPATRAARGKARLVGDGHHSVGARAAREVFRD